jgi:hypothetical protein
MTMRTVACKQQGVSGIGVIALAIGLWIALPPDSPAGRDSSLNLLGWVLASAAGLLILSTLLTVPSGSSESSDPGTIGTVRSAPGSPLPLGSGLSDYGLPGGPVINQRVTDGN